MYHEAVSEPYSFLYTNLLQRDRTKMFMSSFNSYLVPSWNNINKLFMIYSIIYNGYTY